MTTQYIDKDDSDLAPQTFIKRISWGAVFAGLVVVLVTQLTLGVLGIGIGAGIVNLRDDQPDTGVRLGALIWLLFTALISLFLGGHVAARLAGVPRREDSFLHGILTWSTQTIVTALLVTTTIGSALSGMLGLLGNGISGASQAAATIAQQKSMGGSGDTSEQTSGSASVNWDAIKKDAQSLVAASNAPAGIAAQTQGELRGALDAMFGRAGAASEQNREALIGAVARYTGQSREESAQRVRQWEQLQQRAQQQWQQTKEQVKATADEAAGGISKIALWTFLTLILGAAAAALGGLSGRPKSELTTREITA